MSRITKGSDGVEIGFAFDDAIGLDRHRASARAPSMVRAGGSPGEMNLSQRFIADCREIGITEVQQ